MGFFDNFDESRKSSDLLPTTKKDGAPPQARYLMQVVEPTVKFGNDSGNPYVSFSLAVLQPAEYKKRRVFAGFFLVGKDEDATATCQQRTGEGLKAMLGTFPAALKTMSNPEDIADRICELIEDATVVAKIGTEKPKKGTEDEYEAKNKVVRYFPASEWGKASATGTKDDGAESPL